MGRQGVGLGLHNAQCCDVGPNRGRQCIRRARQVGQLCVYREVVGVYRLLQCIGLCFQDGQLCVYPEVVGVYGLLQGVGLGFQLRPIGWQRLQRIWYPIAIGVRVAGITYTVAILVREILVGGTVQVIVEPITYFRCVTRNQRSGSDSMLVNPWYFPRCLRTSWSSSLEPLVW